MTGTNAEKAHYKRIQRARRVAEGMVRVETWLDADTAAQLAWIRQEMGCKDVADSLKLSVMMAYNGLSRTTSHPPQHELR